jgi:gliding motility-associated-like protein
LKQDSFYIYVNDTPNAVLMGPTTICVSGSPLDLNTRINTTQTKPASATGVWTGTSAGVTVTGASSFKPFTLGSATNVEGPHSFRFTYTDNNGCSDTEVYNLFVRNQPTINITTPKPASACEGSPFAIQSTSKYSDAKVQWTLQKHASGTMSDGSFASGNTSENVLYVHGAQDKVQKGAFLKVTTTPITNDVCPTASDSIEIVLHQYPDLSPIAMQTGCVPLTTTWNVTDNRGIPSNQMAYRWDFGNGDTSNLQNPLNVIYPTQGKYNVSVVANNTAGNCKDTSVTTVEAYPIPVAAFVTDPTKTTVALPKFKLTNTSSINGSVFPAVLNYHWDFGVANQSDDTSTAKSTLYSYGKDTATYTIRLITKSDKGCADTAYRNVYVGPDIIVFIPDAFTPDGSGPNKNNTFAPVAMNYKNAVMKIYNRWGEKMYETNDLLKGWDGTANGAECQDGVYLYKISLYSMDDEIYEYSGSITLMR